MINSSTRWMPALLVLSTLATAQALANDQDGQKQQTLQCFAMSEQGVPVTVSTPISQSAGSFVSDIAIYLGQAGSTTLARTITQQEILGYFVGHGIISLSAVDSETQEEVLLIKDGQDLDPFNRRMILNLPGATLNTEDFRCDVIDVQG